MKSRYRITRRGSRGGGFYCVDTQTRNRTSLKTSDIKVARRIVQAKNEAEQQPALNLQLAKAYPMDEKNDLKTAAWLLETCKQNNIDPAAGMKFLTTHFSATKQGCNFSAIRREFLRDFMCLCWANPWFARVSLQRRDRTIQPVFLPTVSRRGFGQSKIFP